MQCPNANQHHLITKPSLISLLLVLIVFASSTFSSSASASSLRLLTHASNTQHVNQQQAKTIFALRQASWKNGNPIQVVIANPSEELHQQFCLDVLRLFPYQLKRIWDRQIYTGNALAPVVVDTHQQLIDYISTHPEAIGYTDQEVSNENLRLLNML